MILNIVGIITMAAPRTRRWCEAEAEAEGAGCNKITARGLRLALYCAPPGSAERTASVDAGVTLRPGDAI